jgi:hypothetical protein
MTDAEGIALEQLRILVQRAGLSLNEAELVAHKPMFDFYREQVQKLHEVELEAEDLAVVFSPVWAPSR